MTVVVPRTSDKEVRQEAKSLESVGKKLVASKKVARSYLHKNGFIRKDGKLTKKYGG
ncbi:hypothetical protein [Puniceicoccus vermicola]|uniref:Uncharacterized protein n=1 Tax=Puniceicoccus vermicola TaxID=388746 RepID=A0A7X1AW97_9BACT|nr:hypothetical protein [Puniceicoccus vermicola]MBC2601165.1 hypothetical protein [Puniceicoccus vermicola]